MGRRLLSTLAVWSLCGCAEDTERPPSGSNDEMQRVQDDPIVGYDLRRLRPTDEPLATMFDRIQELARADGKRVVVLFSADWCEPCKRLDLELGNVHPSSMIADFRILELKEDDWKAAARMDEYNGLRARWEPVAGSYPLMVLLDETGKRVDEMKEAIARLEQQGIEPTLPMWLSAVEQPRPQ